MLTNGVTAARGRGEAAANLGSRLRRHSGATFSLNVAGIIGEETRALMSRIGLSLTD